MNRRRFLQSLAAVFTLPAATTFSMGTATAALPAAAAVPTKARFWAVYMSALHGECTPKTLQNMLHIPEMDAKRYVSQLVADGVIKPNPLVQKSVAKIATENQEGFVDRTKKRPELNAQTGSDDEETLEATEEPEHLELTEDNREISEELIDEQLPDDYDSELEEAENDIPVEIKADS